MSCLRLCAIVIIINPFAILATISDPRWNAFLEEFGKKYEDQVEELMRYEIFQHNLNLIHVHNQRFEAGQTTYTLGITRFSDMTEAELSQLGCLKYGWRSAGNKTKGNYYVRQKKSSELPTFLNWTSRGCVTPVKDQGPCGSCWAFSALGSLEGVACAATGKLIELSEQQMVDCCFIYDKCEGCGGGDPREAFMYIKENGGIMRFADYAYTGKKGQCAFNASMAVESDSGFVDIAPDDEEGLTEAVATYGPVQVGFRTTGSFVNYQGGIFEDATCNWSPTGFPDHGVLVVGFGTTADGIPYWIVKNSWGTKWGENGFFRLRRGKNMCLVARVACFPKL